MEQLHQGTVQQLRKVTQTVEEAGKDSQTGSQRTVRSTGGSLSNVQKPIRTNARRLRQNVKGYRDYLVIARERAGISSLSDFDQLNPYLLDAMIEGYERQQLNQRIELSNLLQQNPFMAQWVSLDQGTMSQINSAIKQTIDQKIDQIEKAHRDMLLDTNDEEVQRADAFAKIFNQKRNQQKGG